MNLKEINIRKLKDIGISRRFYHNSVSFRTERDRYERENVVIANHRIRGCFLGDCIFGSFVWSRSREGHDFWSRIYAKTHED